MIAALQQSFSADPRPGKRALLASASLLLMLALLLGGSSDAMPLHAMLIELVAVATIGIALAFWIGPRPSPLVLIALGFVLLVPLVQLVPLPPEFWMGLPGRGTAADTAGLVDPRSWRPLTLDSDATVAAWLSLLGPVALFLAVLQLGTQARVVLASLFAGMAALSILLGLVQIAPGGAHFYFFESGHEGLPLGFFSNRNHEAALLVAGAIFALALARIARPDAPMRRMAFIGIALVCAAGVVATRSRTGLAALAIEALLSPLLFLGSRIDRRALIGAAVAIAVIAVLFVNSPAMNEAVARFAEADTDSRFRFWPEVSYSISAYFPAGAGFGTFVQSYQETEQLSAVGYHYINHAHNDYMELLLEAGVLGIAGLALFGVYYATRAWRILAGGAAGADGTMMRAALIVILGLMLHSIVDYPLRTYALLTCLGLFFGLLHSAPAQPSEEFAGAEPAPHGARHGGFRPRLVRRPNGGERA